jgi:hypothetical protein
MLAAWLALMFPARSDRVAPEIANRACVGSLIGKLLPGPANEDFDIWERLEDVSLVIMISFNLDQNNSP